MICIIAGKSNCAPRAENGIHFIQFDDLSLANHVWVSGSSGSSGCYRNVIPDEGISINVMAGGFAWDVFGETPEHEERRIHVFVGILSAVIDRYRKGAWQRFLFHNFYWLLGASRSRNHSGRSSPLSGIGRVLSFDIIDESHFGF